MFVASSVTYLILVGHTCDITYYLDIYCLVATTVFFSKSSYPASKFVPRLKIKVCLSKNLSSDFEVQVIDMEGTATGKLCC